MPEFIHERAKHLLAKNPDLKKSTAFALATQQSHKLGKTPKGYGTPEGKREAKQKYDKPRKEYVKTPNPGKLTTKKLPGKAKTRWTGTKMVEKKSPSLLRKPVGEVVCAGARAAVHRVSRTLVKRVRLRCIGTTRQAGGVERPGWLQTRPMGAGVMREGEAWRACIQLRFGTE